MLALYGKLCTISPGALKRGAVAYLVPVLALDLSFAMEGDPYVHDELSRARK